MHSSPSSNICCGPMILKFAATFANIIMIWYDEIHDNELNNNKQQTTSELKKKNKDKTVEELSAEIIAVIEEENDKHNQIDA